MRTLLLGELPTFSKGINKGRLDRKKTAELRGLTIKQVYKAYNNWIQIFRIKGSTLSFEQYLDKLIESNITPEMVGCKIGQYNLSRYYDEGPYTEDSCRFIPTLENLLEEKRGPWNAPKRKLDL